MRNKPYVFGLLGVAVLLIYLAAHLALGESGPIMAAVPGILGLALLAAAFKVAKADSFAPNKAQRWNDGQSPEVQRWLDRRDGDANDDAGDADTATDTTPAAGRGRH